MKSEISKRKLRLVACTALALLGVSFSGCAETELSIQSVHQSQCYPAEPTPPNRKEKATVHETIRLQLMDDTNRVLFQDEATQIIVGRLIATDCPIANAYLPKLGRLQEEYRLQGVEVLLIHSVPGIDSQSAREHAGHFDLNLPVVIDQHQTIAKYLKAEATPEAFLIVRNEVTPLYRGAIDNLYADYGKKRRFVTEHYLKDAIEEVLAGKPVSIPKTNPIGCFIPYQE